VNVLFLAAEAAPFASTGGLGEVIASLPLALDSPKVNCRVLLPAYSRIHLSCETLAAWEMDFDGKIIPAHLKQAKDTELSLYLLDIPAYFERENIYGYEDDILRFGAFCRTALLAQKYFSEQGWEAQVTHCHDWHTALFPVYKSTFNAPGKVLLTIHNLAYQGICDAAFLPRLGLPSSLFNMHQMEFWGKLNPFKGGLVGADAISTVSPTYAKEIQTEDYGCGLEGVLKERADKLYGVINGIDQHVWNPQKDIYLKTSYSASDISGKKICKAELQKKSHLKIDPQIPLVGMVTRLTAQKGIDLLLAAFDEILPLNVQLVILGDGEQELIHQLTRFSTKYPDRISVTTGVFDVALAHQIYAGCDLFLMPSRFEPCGLAQMISMRYGTVPIVRATGGLADTVRQFSHSTSSGNGFVFEEYEVFSLVESMRKAVDCFGSRHWATLQQNAFAADFSWRRSAAEYTKLYVAL